ncbi:unnamed protein product [Amoebophrya sp. A120]|nr:unnamed protein product [Amoebophrya sp. A120]|eukprot:GSA120T00000529001.1
MNTTCVDLILSFDPCKNFVVEVRGRIREQTQEFSHFHLVRYGCKKMSSATSTSRIPSQSSASTTTASSPATTDVESSSAQEQQQEPGSRGHPSQRPERVMTNNKQRSTSKKSANKQLSSTPQNKQRLVLKNPDGSLVAGFSQSYVEPKPPASPANHVPAWLDGGVANELEYIYTKHEQLFLGLLIVQFLIEIVFTGLYIYYGNELIEEMTIIYSHLIGKNNVVRLYTLTVIVELVYSSFYYLLGGMALWKGKAVLFERFASFALFGCLQSVFLAFANKFNLICFLFRLLAYIYARFLRNYLRSVAILQEPSRRAGIEEDSPERGRVAGGGIP